MQLAIGVNRIAFMTATDSWRWGEWHKHAGCWLSNKPCYYTSTSGSSTGKWKLGKSKLKAIACQSCKFMDHNKKSMPCSSCNEGNSYVFWKNAPLKPVYEPAPHSFVCESCIHKNKSVTLQPCKKCDFTGSEWQLDESTMLDVG